MCTTCQTFLCIDCMIAHQSYKDHGYKKLKIIAADRRGEISRAMDRLRAFQAQIQSETPKNVQLRNFQPYIEECVNTLSLLR